MTQTPWPTHTLAYDFASMVPPSQPPGTAGFAPFTSAQQLVAVQAQQTWADVSGLTFTPGAGGITFSMFTSGALIAYGWFPAYGGDVWIRQDINPSLGLSVHEIGHALGLDHATGRTAMAEPPATFSAPRYDDVVVIQGLYGSSAAFSGDTVWGFNANTQRAWSTITDPVFDPMVGAIVDSGGNDTLDLSGVSAVINADMSPGGLTRFGLSTIDMGLGTWVENFISGSGPDVVQGSAIGNNIRGMGGNDQITAGAGDDVVNDWVLGFSSAEGDRVQLPGAYTLTSHDGQALAVYSGGALGFAGVSVEQLGSWLL